MYQIFRNIFDSLNFNSLYREIFLLFKLENLSYFGGSPFYKISFGILILTFITLWLFLHLIETKALKVLFIGILFLPIYIVSTMNDGLYLAKKHPMRTYFIHNTEYSLMFEENLLLSKPQKQFGYDRSEIIALIPRLEVTNRGLDQTIVIHECGDRSTWECIEFIESHNPRIFNQSLKHFTEKDLETLTINSN